MLLRCPTSAARRWASAQAKVEWQNGRRVFHFDDGTYNEWVLKEPLGDMTVFYSKPDNTSCYAQDLPFSTEESDPDVVLVKGGFQWKPTGTMWHRAEYPNSANKYYYYDAEGRSASMTESADPALLWQQQTEGAKAEAAKKQQQQQQEEEEAAAAAAAAAEAEAAAAAEEQKAAEAAAEQRLFAAAEAEAKELRLQEEQRVREEAEVAKAAEAAAAQQAEASEPAAEPVPVPEPEPAAEADTADAEAAPAAEAGTADEAPAATPEVDAGAEAALSRARALMPAGDAARRQLAVGTPSSLAELPQALEVRHGELAGLLHPFPAGEADLRVRVEVGTEEGYCYHLEGLRAHLYYQSAQQIDKQIKAVEDHKVRTHLRERRDTLAEQGFKSEVLSLQGAEALSSESNRRLLAMAFNPLAGAAALFLPNDARRNLLRYVVNVMSLSKALGDSNELSRVLRHEASLAALVLESHREHRRLLVDTKKSVCDDTQTRNCHHAKVIAHYSAETHNGYLFWNGLREKSTDVVSEFGDESSTLIAQAVRQQWGSYDAFCDDFKMHAQSVPGTGYVWLCYEPEHLVRERATVRLFDASEEAAKEGAEEEVLAIGTGEEGEETTAVVEATAPAEEEVVVELTPTEKMLKHLMVREKGTVKQCRLKIITTLKSESPLTYGLRPLFGADLSCVYALDEAFMTEAESLDAQDWGIIPGNRDNFVERYLSCVDWRRAEYQLRLCFPEVLGTAAGLEEADACLKQSPGEVLNSVWMDKVPIAETTSTSYENLVRPVSELKRAVHTGERQFSFGTTDYETFLKGLRPPVERRVKVSPAAYTQRQRGPNTPSRGPGSRQGGGGGGGGDYQRQGSVPVRRGVPRPPGQPRERQASLGAAPPAPGSRARESLRSPTRPSDASRQRANAA